MTIPFLTLRRAAAETRQSVTTAIEHVVDSGQFALGPRVTEFEERFASAIGSEHVIGVASGTDAIDVALRAVGVGPGDEVVTQANTCPPTAAGIARTGATVVLCDVDAESGRMDPRSLADAISPRTRAVVPVHLYGQCADVPELAAAVAGTGIVIVEDCAQAHLARFDDAPAGTLGAASAWSFYPTKNLAALGDAGAVATDAAEVAERAGAVRQYADFGRASAAGVGINSRLDELQAAVLLAKLPLLPDWTDRRRKIADLYRAALSESTAPPLALDPRCAHVYHLFVVRCPNRERFRQALLERGVETAVHYPTPIHRLPAWEDVAVRRVPLRASEQLCAEVVSLPLYPQLTDAEVEVVADTASAAAAELTLHATG